MTLCSDNFRSF